MTKPEPKDVDSYIAAAPKAAQPMLRELRRVIRAAAPRAEEKISYGMPYYSHHGRLVYFAAHKNHVGLYAAGVGSATDAKELEKYRAAKSTLQFPFGDPLPATLITKLVKARVKENEARGKT